MSDPICGAIEAGGTKFVCAVGSGPGALKRVEFETTTPAETLARTLDFLQSNQPLRAVGIGSFGPVDLNRSSSTYGYITSTPKPGWQNCDITGAIRRKLNVPVAFDTDVNAAAMGESRWGAGQNLENILYVTVGTGIGGGAIAGGKLVHGLVHPEMGHIRVPHDIAADPFPGGCVFHRDCLEGLASGKAIADRWGQRGESLPPDHPAWDLEARYLALGVANWICTLSPQRIILGGSVMKAPGIFMKVRREVQSLLNAYVKAAELEGEIDAYIVPPGLGDDAGVLGALALAQSIPPLTSI